MRKNCIAVAEAVLIALVILAGSIALPILLRPFYYLHIEPLKLPEQTGLSVAQIKTAYGEMLDFCIGLSNCFSVGELPFSQPGADHFTDVRKLFLLDLWTGVVAAILLVIITVWQRKKPLRLAGHTPGFWSAVGLSAVFAAVGGLSVLDFDRAFTVFHELLFPGKENWLFYPEEDPIIWLLPEVFFRNCALLILGVLVVCCISLLIRDAAVRRK